MHPGFAALLVLVVCLLHQDIWLWHQARPLVFGVLPVGLAYHVAYVVGAAVLMWVLVRYHWPDHLDETPPQGR